MSNKQITANLDNEFILSQELFHAYQADLNVYDPKTDRSVMETEGDLVSQSLFFELGGLTVKGMVSTSDWDQNILFNDKYVDKNQSFNIGVLNDEFEIDFNKAVDARIDYYLKRESSDGVESPSSYTQKNSGKKPIALQKLVLDMNNKK